MTCTTTRCWIHVVVQVALDRLTLFKKTSQESNGTTATELDQRDGLVLAQREERKVSNGSDTASATYAQAVRGTRVDDAASGRGSLADGR